MWKIKNQVIESIKQASQNVYPNEFLALLGGLKDEKVIDEIVVVPATYGPTYAFLRRDLIPFDSRILGSVHSHPSHPNPSMGDVISFPRMGIVHAIISYPFDVNSLKLFDSRGKELKYEIIY
jgi:proteasome lid subunit RPN8/RPN11